MSSPPDGARVLHAVPDNGEGPMRAGAHPTDDELMDAWRKADAALGHAIDRALDARLHLLEVGFRDTFKPCADLDQEAMRLRDLQRTWIFPEDPRHPDYKAKRQGT